MGAYGCVVVTAWYLTKAIAASSLQNSSRTMTPARAVMSSELVTKQQQHCLDYTKFFNSKDVMIAIVELAAGCEAIAR